MKQYIDREAVLQKRLLWIESNKRSVPVVMVEDIETIPAADVAEVRHGQWQQVEVTDYPNSNLMVASMWCPVCKRYHNEVYYYGNPTEMAHYCGFCGAKMDGDVNDA